MTRQNLNQYLIQNQKELKHKIKFIFNDLWSFDSKNLDFCIDLKTAENLTPGFAYGIWLSGYLPVIYSVSFFTIGRFEQIRKFFGFQKAPIMIINAGAYGYDKYGWEHAFKNEDDIKIMEALHFKIIDLKEKQYDFDFIFNKWFQKQNSVHIRLWKD